MVATRVVGYPLLCSSPPQSVRAPLPLERHEIARLQFGVERYRYKHRHGGYERAQQWHTAERPRADKLELRKP